MLDEWRWVGTIFRTCHQQNSLMYTIPSSAIGTPGKSAGHTFWQENIMFLLQLVTFHHINPCEKCDCRLLWGADCSGRHSTTSAKRLKWTLKLRVLQTLTNAYDLSSALVRLVEMLSQLLFYFGSLNLREMENWIFWSMIICCISLKIIRVRSGRIILPIFAQLEKIISN
jgi:hypothetical protein